MRLPALGRTAAVALVACLSLTACGSAASGGQEAGSTSTTTNLANALDDYAAAENTRLRGEGAVAAEYEIKVSAVAPGTAHYEYTFKQAVDPIETGAALETSAPELKQSIEETVLPAMRALGIEQPAVRHTYYNPDGGLIWELTHPES